MLLSLVYQICVEQPKKGQNIEGKDTVAHSGIFLGNFRESSGKFLDNFSFLENFFNVSLLFL